MNPNDSNSSEEVAATYVVRRILPADLTPDERAACISIITRGGAVDPAWAEAELPRAAGMAIATKHGQVVGVGTIKGKRPWYAVKLAKSSGAVFDQNTLELGYVAIDDAHQNRRLSTAIVQELLSKHSGPLFATTDDACMKKSLTKAGFVQRGEEWDGERGRLSLWIKN